METNFNLGSLKIVYNPLMEYFKKIQEKVVKNLSIINSKNYSESDLDYDDLDLFIKVQSSLKMIGLNGLVQILDLNQEAFEYTKVVSVEDKLIIFNKIQQCLVKVDFYMQNLLDGALDEPTKLFDVYSALAETIGKNVFISELFHPKLDLIRNADTVELNKELRLGKIINEENKSVLLEELNSYQNKIVKSLDVIINFIIKNEDFNSIEERNEFNAECRNVYNILSAIQNNKISKSYYILLGLQKILVSISSPISNESFKDIISIHKEELKYHINNITKSLNTLKDEIIVLKIGEKTGSLKPNEDMVKETMLFIIDLTNNYESLKEMPVFKELNSVFNFNFYKKQLEGASLKITLKQDNPGLLNNLENKLIELKEEIIILTGKNLAENMLDHHLTKVIDLSNSFRELFESEPVALDFLNKFLLTSEKIKNKEINFDEEIKRELSLSVVFLELVVKEILNKEESNDYLKTELELISNRLDNAINKVDNNSLPLPSLDIVSKKDEEDKVLLVVFKEISQELSYNEEILDGIIRTEDVDNDELDAVLKSFKNISGVFKMLGNKNLSILVDNILNVWKEIKENGLEEISKEVLNNSISWLSGLSLYVETYQDGNDIEAEEIEFKVLSQFKNFMGDKVTLEDMNNVIEIPYKDETKDSNEFPLIDNYIEELKSIENIVDPDKEIKEAISNTINVLKLDQAESIIGTVSDQNIDSPKLEDGFVMDVVSPVDETTEFFFLEMEEVKETLLESLNKLKENKEDTDSLITIRRAFHTIKGSGKMVGFNNMGEVAWIVEEKLNNVLATKESITNEMLVALENIANKIFNWCKELEANDKCIFNLNNEKEEFITLFTFKENTVAKEELVNEEDISQDLIVEQELNTIDEMINNLEKENKIIETEKEENVTVVKEKDEIDNDLLVAENSKIDDSNIPVLNEDINILGKDIALDIYKSFKEEFFEINLGLKAYVSSMLNINKPLGHEFMRGSHTISSISKSVNLMSLSNIAKEMENLAIISSEVNKGFSRIEMKSLKYVVDSLEYFENIENDISENSEYYVEIIEILLDLKDILEKEDIVAPTLNEQKETLMDLLNSEFFTNKINETISASLNEIKDNLSVESENSLLDNDISKQLNDIQESIKNLQKDYKEEIKELAIKVGYNRRDLKSLHEIVKKKSSKSNHGNSNFEVVNSEEKWGEFERGLDSKSEKIATFLEKNPNLKIIFEEKISTIENEIEEEIFEISKEEIENMFINIDGIMEKIPSNSIVQEDISSLKRDIHTLKGSVRMYGNNQMGLIAHRLESLLDFIENHNININEIYEILELEIDKLKFLNENIDIQLTPNQAVWLDNVSSDELLGDDTVLVTESFNEKNNKKFNIQSIKVVSKVLDDLINEAGEMRLSRTTLEGTVDNNKKYVNDLRNSSIKIQKILKELELKAELQINAQEITTNDHFDPLEFDKYTRLQELTRFLHEAVEDVKDSIHNMEVLHKVQENTVIKQSILTDNMLDTLMDVRLVSVDSVADKFYKIVRLTAKDANKLALLSLSGEKHEVDRLVLEKIQHPIEHLLRNCLIHGIELPEERKKLGKSPQGLIKIDISVDGSFIIFNIEDDGSGINVDRIKEKALEKGLIEENVEYTKDELLELIFKPGFTTATLTQNAGRGIGMDVVRSEVLSLGGSIKIETEEGKGSQFIIALPLSVATNQAMLTTVEDKLFAIPAMFIEEVISVKTEELKNGYSNGFISFRKEKHPLYYLGHLSGVVDWNILPTINNYNTLIVITYLGQKIIVHVDTLKTIEEVVIKSAGKTLGKINGLLGLTLLGDGRQGLVVNPVLLVEHFNKFIKGKNNKVLIKNSESDKGSNSKLNKKLTALVVDDSITIRRATSKFLEKNNINVILAKDGEDALKQLQDNTPDIILSDIEMPVMDGFELVKNIKSINKFKDIPIIMITSRTADKHKKLAFSLGANGFLGKPYQEEELIKTIKSLL